MIVMRMCILALLPFLELQRGAQKIVGQLLPTLPMDADANLG